MRNCAHFNLDFESGLQLVVFYIADQRINTLFMSMLLNAFHAAGECRREVNNLTNFAKNVNIVEFHYHIWNHREKSIHISTNISSIGLVIPEITCEMLEF